MALRHSETYLIEPAVSARLDASRQQLFVGRREELRLFTSALEDAGTLSVLLVTGETGVGKTALLDHLASLAAERRSPCVHLVAPSMRGKDADDALESTLQDLHAVAVTARGRPVLFVDDLDALGYGETAFVRKLLPLVPGRTLVVLASRRDVTARHLEESGIVSPLFRHARLGPLDPIDALDYLERRQLPPGSLDEVTRFARGNALLLTCAANLGGGPPASLLVDIVEPLALARVAHEVASLLDTDDRRVALATLTLTRATVYELLGATLGKEADVDAAFEWLGQLSFVEHTSLGLRPHSVVRLACRSMLRRDHPSLCAWVTARARAFQERQIHRALEPRRWLADRLFMDSDFPPPVSKPTQGAVSAEDDESEDSLFADVPRPHDREEIERMATRHEDVDAAERVLCALDTTPTDVEVLRAATGEARGFLVCHELLDMPTGRATAPIHASSAGADPAAALVADYLEQARWSPGQGGRAFIVRDWMSTRDHQAPGAASRVLVAQMASRLLLAPQVRYHFGVTHRRDAWIDYWRALGFEHVLLGSFRRGERDVAVFAYDWRKHATASGQAVEADTTTGTSDFGALLRARLGELATSARLTAREREVLDLVVLGRNASEIGTVLDIAARTAKFHQSRMLAKLGADSRMDLFRLLM